jgi:penicillin-binding protein 1A
MWPDGAVRAMVGGRDYNENQFNRATQAQRQPGSAFKPFVYLAGLEAGLRPSDQFADAPIRIGNWQRYRLLPGRNDPGRRAGPVYQLSVQVAQQAGIRNIVAIAHRLGILSEVAPEMSLALGTNESNLLQLASAYAPFANGGVGVWPYGITESRDADGKAVFRRAGSGAGRVISNASALIMSCWSATAA